jgi:hypothetical protein
MRLKFARSLGFSLLLTLWFAFSIPAQPAQSVAANAFAEGEVLTYEGKLNKYKLLTVDVAELTFIVDDAPDVANSANSTDAPKAADKTYRIKAEAVSKGGLLKLFNFKFLQKLESEIDGDKFRVLRTVKYDEQGDRVRNSDAVFDYDNRKVTYVETDPKDRSRPPRKLASNIQETTHDLISGIYMLRRLPLAVGKSFELTVSDSGLVYSIPVRVTAREQQKTILGKVWAFRVEPEVFGPRRFIEGKGRMIIWITDDERRIPVRSQIHTTYGKVEVRLKQSSYDKPLLAAK